MSNEKWISFVSPNFYECSTKSENCITDFQEEKITEEKTHWSLESLVSSGYEDNDAFSPEHYYTNKKNITNTRIIERLGIQ